MSRSSPYPIKLTIEEAEELSRRAAAYSLPYYVVQRAKMILLASSGFTNTEIAKRLDTRREIVSQWRHRFFYFRLEGLKELPRSGRPFA